MDVVAQLLDEHDRIRTRLRSVRLAFETPTGAGSPPPPLSALADTLREVDALLAHHAHKEEEALFPALERRTGPVGPTQVMRAEHRAIHARGALVRETLRELAEVEHPKIDAARAALHRSLGEDLRPDTLRAMVDDLLQLIEVHFMREERVLFPMTGHLLSAADFEEVASRMRALDGTVTAEAPGHASPDARV